MQRNERGATWFAVCMAIVAGAFGLAVSRGRLFSTDWLTTQYSLWNAYGAGLKAGSLSLWNPLQYGGYPLLATGAVAALYPPVLLLHALLPVDLALSVLVLLHLLWAAAGAFLLARRLGARAALAAAAAAAFALGGLWLSPIAALNAWLAAAWLPWLVWLTDRLLSPGASLPSAAGLLALALGLAKLAWGPTGWSGGLVVLASALILYLVHKPGARVLGWLALALVLSLLLTLPQLLPAREWAAWSVPAGGARLLASRAAWLPLLVLVVALLAARGLELALARRASRAPEVIVTVVVIAGLLGGLALRLPAGQNVASTRPRSVDFLLPQTGLYRIYSQPRANAVPSADRESLANGLGAAYGLPVAGGGPGAVPRLYAAYAAELAPHTLDLLGVKYYLIPQPHGADGQDDDLNDPFTYNPMDKVAPTPIVMSTIVELEWYLSDAADLINGRPVALLTIVPEEMDEAVDINLTAGSHVADWAYDRSDVRAVVRHSQARIARTFPARSGNPPEDHTGYVYAATILLHYPVLTQGLWFQSRIDPARIHIERVVMVDETGERHVLAELEGKSDHVLVYRSPDVAILENYDVLPRAFLAYRARAVPDDAEALNLLRSAEFNPRQEVLLAAATVTPVTPPTQGTEGIAIRSYAPEKVVLDVTAPAAGYLVLTDAWYPGWQARVDGRPVPVERADVLFRAVHLEPGDHAVEFVYQPASFRQGLLAAGAALLASLALFVAGLRRTGHAQPTPTPKEQVQ